jgi:hypothetical protein
MQKAQGAKKDPRKGHPIWRYVVAPLLGAALTFGGLVVGVADAGVAAGLYGTHGTYTVDSCEDTDHSRKHSDYVCTAHSSPTTASRPRRMPR